MPSVAISDWGDAIFLALSNALNTFLAAIPQVIGGPADHHHRLGPVREPGAPRDRGAPPRRCGPDAAAANVLGMPEVSIFLNKILLWIPNRIVAAVILLVARFVRGAIEVGAGEMGFTNAPILGWAAERRRGSQGPREAVTGRSAHGP